MTSINEQLGVPLLNNGMTTYQPIKYSGGIDNYIAQNAPVVVGTSYYQGANGKESWSGCNSCGMSSANGSDWSNAYGVSYPALIYPAICTGKHKTQCKECKDYCKDNLGLGWKKGGRECFISCFEGKVRTIQSGVATPNSTNIPITPLPTANTSSTDNLGTDNTGSSTSGEPNLAGMSTNMKIGLAVGGIALLGLVFFLARR